MEALLDLLPEQVRNKGRNGATAHRQATVRAWENLGDYWPGRPNEPDQVTPHDPGSAGCMCAPWVAGLGERFVVVVARMHGATHALAALAGRAGRRR